MKKSFSGLVSPPPAVYITGIDKQLVIHGRTITGEELEGVRNLLQDHPDWTRLHFSREVCAAWDWRDAKGGLRDMACRTVLLRLHRSGEINLPAPRHSIDNRRRPLGWKAHDTNPVRLPLRELVPLDMSIPRPGSADARLLRFLLEQYHYLGLAHVPGENIGYLIRSLDGREPGCLLFAAEGINFEVHLVEGIPNADAKQIYADADLVVDQLLVGWYGGFAAEAMAMGKPVVAYIHEDDKQLLPANIRSEVSEAVINASPSSIVDVLRRCHSDRQWLKTKVEAGLEYSRKWHNAENVAKITTAAYES